MLNEHGIENQILLALSQHGCTMARTNAGKVKTQDGRVIMLCPKGWPDLTGFHHATGKVVFIEVKTEKGRLSKEQVNFQKMIQTVSPKAIYGVARSAKQAIEILNNGINS